MVARQAAFHFAFGPKIGLGHAVRCAALADALSLEGWRCGLLATSPHLLPSFVARSFDAEMAGEVDLLVVDHCEPDLVLVDQWRSRSERVLQIYDGSATPLFGDLVLNQNADVMNGSLHGPAYALVRQAFPESRPHAKRALDRERATRVLVMPGSTDVAGVCKALVGRRRISSSVHFTFILSSLAPYFADLSCLAGSSDGRLALVGDATPAQVAQLMLEHDLLVGNGGSGNWERCTLGLPSVTVVMADNQRANAAALAAFGATIFAGEAFDEHVMSTIYDVIDGPVEVLRELSARSFAVTDGLGAYRVAAALTPDTNRNNQTITLRSATASDCDRVFHWQEHPETRRYSRNPEIPPRDEHVAWFTAKLHDHRCIFSIVLADGAEAGVVRLDYRDMVKNRPCYEISIYIDPSRYGQGIGSAALRAARRLTPFAWRKAFVDQQNAASLALFASQGYRKDGTFLYDPALC